MSSFLLDNKYQISWNEYGIPDGEPVFYFHGTPGSRLEAHTADAVACDLGLRLIAPDRPGYGDSDPQANFSLLDWPNVISQLADNLNLDRFSILSFSMGGAYALACAHEISDRIKHITLIGSPAPFETEVMQHHINADFKPLYELSAADTSAAIELVSQLATSPESLLETLKAPLPATDKILFEQAHFQKHYMQSLTLATNNGVNGIVNDLRNLALPWQFNLQTIQTDIDIWHGRDDVNFGCAVGEYLADTLKNNSSHFLDDCGHLFIFKQWRKILERTKTQATRRQ